MRNGGLASALRSIFSHFDTLTPDSVIMVTGGRIQVEENYNVRYCPCREAERLGVLPANLWMVLSTRQRSHQLGDNISRLAKKEHREVPQYILPAGMLKQVLELILKQIHPPVDEPCPTMRPIAMLRQQPKPQPADVIATPPIELELLGFRRGCSLFRDFFTTEEVSNKSYMTLALEFTIVLSMAKARMLRKDFRKVIREHCELASWVMPDCDDGRRRDRQGNLPKRRLPPKPPKW